MIVFHLMSRLSPRKPISRRQGSRSQEKDKKLVLWDPSCSIDLHLYRWRGVHMGLFFFVHILLFIKVRMRPSQDPLGFLCLLLLHQDSKTLKFDWGKEGLNNVNKVGLVGCVLLWLLVWLLWKGTNMARRLQEGGTTAGVWGAGLGAVESSRIVLNCNPSRPMVRVLYCIVSIHILCAHRWRELVG